MTETGTSRPASFASLFWQRSLLLLFLLALVFSILPMVLAMVLNKSSLALAVFTAWYALWPSLILFLLALWIYSKEANWLRALGKVWVGLSIWFLLQCVLDALKGVHLIFLLLSLTPALAGGAQAFLVGGLAFLFGGTLLWILGWRVPNPSPRPGLSWAALALLLFISVVGLPLAAVLTAQIGAGRTSAVPLPTQDQIFGFVSDVYNMGERRPGSAADQDTIAYLQAKFREFGYSDVHAEWGSFDYWEPVKWALTVQPGDPGAWAANVFYVPYSGPTAPEGITAPIVDLGEVSAPKWQDVSGKVVLVDIPATDLSWDQMKLFTFMAFDPQESATGWHHPYPIGWGGDFVSFYDQVKSRNPAGIIGILRDYPPMGAFTYYCPYDGLLRPIPSLYIQEKDGERLKSQAAAGNTTVNLVLDANVSENGGRSATVYAVLPGKSASTLLIHSHHDSDWQAGVEDSSGTGMVLGLAQYYAQVPLAQREDTMVFLLDGSHFVGTPTNRDFVAQHKGNILANTVFDLAFEHIADDYNPPSPASGNVEPRGTFITENPVVVGQYSSVIAQQDAIRSLVFPTGSPLGVPTDAYDYYNAGVPVVSLISGPSWLFDQGDTLDRVAKAELAPTAARTVDFINRLNATPAWLYRFTLGWLTVGLLVVIFSPLALAVLAWRSPRAGRR